MSSAPTGTFSISPKIPPLVKPMLFKSNKNQKNINTITLDKLLGKGAYGTVYMCRDENGEKLAVKCIKTMDFGIPSLIEASIMSVIHHPNLSKALKIHSTPEKLYIVQELAISDLRVYRVNNEISEELAYRWIHMICQGINCLHKHDIIHGDIKASNILVYPGEKIKISDFTLATNTMWKNKYCPCTPTHRPLEIWLGNSWGKSVDIWSLGCTIFELVYGKTLFVNQTRDAFINALLDWYNYLPSQYKYSDINVSYRETFHYTFSLPDSFNVSSPLDSLILSTLIIDPSYRPSVEEILKYDQFRSYPKVPSMVISSPITFLLPKTEKKLRKKLAHILNDKITIELSYNLYSRLTGMVNANDNIKMLTCSWIAHKMVHRKNISLDILPCELHEILQMERNICDYLSYRLYCKTNQVVFRDNKYQTEL